MLDLLRKIFPLWRTARKARPRHFRLIPAAPPPLLEDMPEHQVAEINAHSEDYFAREQNREFWLNKPFSDPETAGWYLSRFGQLIAGLKPRPGDRILDFGCGSGWTSLMLAKTGAEVVGMDIAEAALKIARQNIPDGASVSFTGYNGKQIPAEDASFDYVILFEAFHHLPNPRTLLDEFFRVLAPNGILGFAEPGVGHSLSESSAAETEHGVLEHDVDVEQLYRSALRAGFIDMQLFMPALHPHSFALSMTRARWFLRGISMLFPANILRLALLTSPVGILYKGPYKATSRHPHFHRASIAPTVSTLTVEQGQEFALHVRMTNPSDTVWLKEYPRGIGYVRLGAHLLNDRNRMLNYDYGRASLPRDLRQNESADLVLTLNAPGEAGNYILRLDAVNEGVCWFEEAGSNTVDVLLTVN